MCAQTVLGAEETGDDGVSRQRYVMPRLPVRLATE
jgi:hypothetical protein